MIAKPKPRTHAFSRACRSRVFASSFHWFIVLFSLVGGLPIVIALVLVSRHSINPSKLLNKPPWQIRKGNVSSVSRRSRNFYGLLATFPIQILLFFQPSKTYKTSQLTSSFFFHFCYFYIVELVQEGSYYYLKEEQE